MYVWICDEESLLRFPQLSPKIRTIRRGRTESVHWTLDTGRR